MSQEKTGLEKLVKEQGQAIVSLQKQTKNTTAATLGHLYFSALQTFPLPTGCYLTICIDGYGAVGLYAIHGNLFKVTFITGASDGRIAIEPYFRPVVIENRYFMKNMLNNDGCGTYIL